MLRAVLENGRHGAEPPRAIYNSGALFILGIGAVDLKGGLYAPPVRGPVAYGFGGRSDRHRRWHTYCVSSTWAVTILRITAIPK